DIAVIRKRILDEFDAANSSDDRGRVLAVFKAVMDLTERNLIAQNEGELLESFRKAREQDYKICIVQECTVGLKSPGGGDVSVERMMAVTNREIAAGRMSEQHCPLHRARTRSAAVTRQTRLDPAAAIPTAYHGCCKNSRALVGQTFALASLGNQAPTLGHMPQ
ncbi:MAG: hypothetical protein JWO52_5525, partial [Gammaproteobacteria bacterium]|nr:hypothetical protein [Gammaproteobacteria bacterium]